jgi:hypothetical protein
MSHAFAPALYLLGRLGLLCLAASPVVAAAGSGPGARAFPPPPIRSLQCTAEEAGIGIGHLTEIAWLTEATARVALTLFIHGKRDPFCHSGEPFSVREEAGAFVLEGVLHCQHGQDERFELVFDPAAMRLRIGNRTEDCVEARS